MKEDYLEKYAIRPFINAHDTITLYGASRMAENTKDAMRQIAGCFTDLIALQRILGDRIAQCTNNEAAYIANCAAGALQLCAAVCIAKGNEHVYRSLPDTKNRPDEIIIMHSQHNCYDKALEAAGAKLRLVGDADETLEFDLENTISAKTAAVFYCPAASFARGSLPLETVIAIAHQKGVPLIVDAAAQLPPRSNLWTFTQAGADMVVFSGGKTLCGPQTSGLLVGKKEYIEDCRRFGSPLHGVCRSAKASKESMLGLCVAIENYMQLDEAAERCRVSDIVDKLIRAMQPYPVYSPYRVETGSVGQAYPRAFAAIHPPASAGEIVRFMREKGIFIGTNDCKTEIYLSPLNLSAEECETVCTALREAASALRQ